MCRLFMITIQSPYPIIVYSVAKYRPHQGPILVTFGQICNFRDLNLVTFYFCELARFFKDRMKNTLLLIYSTNTLVRLLTVNMKDCLIPNTSESLRPNCSNSIENATPL